MIIIIRLKSSMEGLGVENAKSSVKSLAVNHQDV
jgi:hypothetical protein